MIRPIMKNEFFLQQPSDQATPADLPIAMTCLVQPRQPTRMNA